MDQATEGRERVLLLLQQRRSGEAEIAGLRQQTAHLGGELTVATIAAGLGAVAFINQDEHVGVVIHILGGFSRSVELVDDGCDERCLVADQVDQMGAAVCTNRFKFAGLERVLDLLVEIVPVRDDQDARIRDGLIERKRTAQHDHGQRLARSLCVPDHTALSPPIKIEMADALHGFADAEKLLVTGDLACAAIEHGETADQIQQAFRSTQRVNCPVLRRDCTLAFGRQRLEMGTRKGKVARKYCIRFGGGQRPVCHRIDHLVAVFFVAPGLPELPWGPDGGIAGLDAVHHQQKLREVEQLRNVVFVLIPDELAARLLQALGGPLVLDHQKRDAIHVSDDIAAFGLGAGRSLD